MAASGSQPAGVLLITTLILSTLAFGAVQAWAWAIGAVLVATALFLWACGAVRNGLLRIRWSPLCLPVVAFLLVGLIQLWGHLTADPIATRESLLKLAADLIVFFLAAQLWNAQSRSTTRSFAIVIVGFTCLLALFGISQFFVSPGTIYGVVKPRWGGWVFGPYVNHNHYAGVMEVLIPIVFCHVFALKAGSGRNPVRLLGLFTVILALVSLLLSGSRGGLISLVSELILMGGIVLLALPWWTRRRLAVAVLTGVAGVALLFLWLDPGQTSKRLGSIADISRAPEATLGERLTLARDSLRIFRDHPWLGSGLGSFAAVYPRYRSFPSDLEWDHAHNDYAELLAETGIAGAIPMLCALVLFTTLAFCNLNHRLDSGAGWISLGAAVGCCGLLVHSMVDFNLHIPANAAWFSLSAGLAIAPAGLGACRAQEVNKPLPEKTRS